MDEEERCGALYMQLKETRVFYPGKPNICFELHFKQTNNKQPAYSIP